MAEADDRPGYSFNPGPPPEASRFLANKGWAPAFSWLDVEPDEHAVAFTVAKATSMDVLHDIREELQAALDQGLPFAAFQKRLTPRLQARGWWGSQVVTDPGTGEDVLARLGTPRRLRTIYDANLRSARAAGQWDRIQRTKQALPFLEYRLGPSERHRPHHAAKEYLVLPVDDPFWATWYPPNGWGCKCWVRQITRRAAEALGISDSPAIDTREWLNNRTGELRQVPVGIDPGWERNPGAARRRNMEVAFGMKLNGMSDQDRRTVLRDIATSWAIRSRAADDTLRVPIAYVPPRIAEAIGTTADVAMSPRSAQHLFAEKADRSIRDIEALEHLPNAALFRLRTDGAGRKSLHVLIEEAADSGAADRSMRLPLSAIMYFEAGRLLLVTMHRVSRTKWLRRTQMTGYRKVD